MPVKTARPVIAALFGLLTHAVAWPADQARLVAPFAARQPATAIPRVVCPATPAPVTALAITSKYGNDGPLRDTVDAGAASAERAQMAPIQPMRRWCAGCGSPWRRP